MKDVLFNAASAMGRWRWRPSLAGAFVLLLVSVFANLPAQVTAKSMADLAVWQIVNKKRTYTGTAFAIRERHFLTNAHVIEGFVDHDSKQIVLRQQGNALELTVNYRRVALSLTYDLALFTTRRSGRARVGARGTRDHHPRVAASHRRLTGVAAWKDLRIVP